MESSPKQTMANDMVFSNAAAADHAENHPASTAPNATVGHTAMIPTLLDEAQAAQFFGVSKRTFLTLRSESWMPRAIVLGPRLHRWSVDELRAAVASMPRASARPQPDGLLRARIEKLKATGRVE